MDLTNEDVADILALLDSLPYDELDLQTPRFRLVLRRTPDGWTQSTEIRRDPAEGAPGIPNVTGSMLHRTGDRVNAPSTRLGSDADGADEVGRAEGAAPGADGADGELVEVRAPLPGTFYWAPRPGAPPFVVVGGRVGAEDVVGIVETMKLMNSVIAGVDGTVAEICVGNAEFAANGTTLLRIRAD
jgi:acetyl-CoA carboxylase biotin carboxyl carrier protein